MNQLPIEWKTRHVFCNLCRNDSASQLWVKDGFQYVRCENCGLVYVNPQLIPSEIQRIYEIGFQSKSSSKPTPTNTVAYEPILRWASQYRQTMQLLDVGCFKGHLLVAARDRGWVVHGTEISEQAAEYARIENKLDVFLGPLSQAGYASEMFDVVVMRDVIEHLSDPHDYLREVHRLLRPGGGLYIDTPNFDSLTRRLLGKEWSVFFPWHQYFFTAKTLQQLLRQSGFVIRRVQCLGMGPISCYNALRSLHQRQEIVSSSRRRLKAFAECRAPFLKRPYFFLQSIANAPFYVLSSIGVYVGSKIIVLTEKAG